MSTEPAKPDAGMTDIDAMSVVQIQAELQRYKPGTQAEVVSIEE